MIIAIQKSAALLKASEKWWDFGGKLWKEPENSGKLGKLVILLGDQENFSTFPQKFPRFSVFSYLLEKFYTFNSDRFEDVFLLWLSNCGARYNFQAPRCLIVAVPYTIFRPKTILFHLFLKFLKVYHGLPLFLHSKKAEKMIIFQIFRPTVAYILGRYCNPRFDPNFKIIDFLGNLLAPGRRQDF